MPETNWVRRGLVLVHPGTFPEPSDSELAAYERQPYDEAAVVRWLDGDRTVQLRKGDRPEIVRRARAAGMPWRDIEAQLKIGRPTRYLPAELKGTGTQRTPEPTRRLILELVAQGHSLRSTAARAGVAHRTVQTIIQREERAC